MKLTYYGHSCFSVNINGKQILFDPFISGNDAAKHIDIEAIKADYILLTHGHEDHIADVEQIASNQDDVLIVANFEVANYFSEKGFSTHPVNHGGTYKNDLFSAKYVQAVHTSSFPDGSYAGQPGGFVVKTDNHCFYNAGDTALTYDMKLIGEEFSLDFALLPIGDNFTMGYNDAAKAASFIQCNTIIGIHYDTFGYIEIDHSRAKEVFTQEDKELILLDIGEERTF